MTDDPLPTLPEVPVERTDVKTSFYLSPRLLREAKVTAAAHGVSLRVLLVRALEDFIGRHQGLPGGTLRRRGRA